jgi:hypothetical protein
MRFKFVSIEVRAVEDFDRDSDKANLNYLNVETISNSQPQMRLSSLCEDFFLELGYLAAMKGWVQTGSLQELLLGLLQTFALRVS